MTTRLVDCKVALEDGALIYTSDFSFTIYNSTTRLAKVAQISPWFALSHGDTSARLPFAYYVPTEPSSEPELALASRDRLEYFLHFFLKICQAVLQLGRRYLWMDMLCVTHDEEVLRVGIAHMMFSHASGCIVLPCRGDCRFPSLDQPAD